MGGHINIYDHRNHICKICTKMEPKLIHTCAHKHVHTYIHVYVLMESQETSYIRMSIKRKSAITYLKENHI